MIADPILVSLEVAEALDACRVNYLIGGSLSSSISGEPRSTLDIDIVVAMSESNIAAFVAALGGAFYVEPETLRRAIREKSSTNLIHHATSMKIDIFVSGASPLDGLQMERRQRVQVASGPDRWLYFYTPEDILLQKLRWYRLGSEVSDRQWRDVLGIVRVQTGKLDLEYLRDSAKTLGVADLLDRALREAPTE